VAAATVGLWPPRASHKAFASFSTAAAILWLPVLTASLMEGSSLLTPASSLLTPDSSLLTPISSLLTPVSSLTPVVRGSHSSTLTRDQPPTSPPPVLGPGEGHRKQYGHPAWPPATSPPPICGAAGEPATPARIQLTHPRSYNPPCTPTWASVVRGEGTCAVQNPCPLQQPAITAADFSVLYDRCSASGLKATLLGAKRC
jgi:hypothetical protein